MRLGQGAAALERVSQLDDSAETLLLLAQAQQTQRQGGDSHFHLPGCPGCHTL